MANSGPTQDTLLDKLAQTYSGFSSVDEKRRPQDDFFAYVNGLWLDHYEMPEDKGRYGAFIALRDHAEAQIKSIIDDLLTTNKANLAEDDQKIVDLYQSYMDIKTLEHKKFIPLSSILADINSLSNTQDLIKLMANLKQLGVKTPIGSYVDIDPKAENKYMLVLGQSGLGLPDREYYLSGEDKYLEYQSHYQRHIAKMLNLAGIDDVEKKAEQIFALEKTIAQSHWTRSDCRDVQKTFNKFKAAELESLGKNIDWQSFLVLMGVNVEEVCVSQPDAFTKLDNIFADTPLEVWKAYLTWQTLHAFAPFLHQAVVDENFDFYGRSLNDIPKQRDRYKRAIDLVNGAVGETLGKHYVNRFFTSEAKEKMIQLVGNLKEAFKQGIAKASWMDPSTKEEALAKLDAMTVKVGYPDRWRSYGALSIAADDLMGNIIRSNRLDFQREMDKTRKPIDRNEWLMDPQTVNAYNYPKLNDICFPAAILQPPFFSLDATDAMNYGGIGAVIAHEMGHGFDDQGRAYDRAGKLRDWWTESDAAEYKRRTDMLVDQYNGYEPLAGLHVNGRLTLGENVADLTGLSMALLAYKLARTDNPESEIKGFTPKQQVFLNWAQIWQSKAREGYLRTQIQTDPHSPGQYRCNGIVSNLNSFHKAFDVKPGDSMYREPEKRIKLWK